MNDNPVELTYSVIDGIPTATLVVKSPLEELNINVRTGCNVLNVNVSVQHNPPE